MATAEPSAAARHLVVALRQRRLIAAPVIAAVVLVAIFGWSESRYGTGPPAASTVPTSVSGVVLIEGGPVQWAVIPRAFARCDRPRLVVTGTTSAGARLVRHLTANTDGRFTLTVPAGTYTVTALIIRNARMTERPSQKITVRGGHPVRVRITFGAT